MGSRKIIVPQGLIDPNETTIIEVPITANSDETLIAREFPEPNCQSPRRVPHEQPTTSNMATPPRPGGQHHMTKKTSRTVIEETTMDEGDDMAQEAAGPAGPCQRSPNRTATLDETASTLPFENTFNVGPANATYNVPRTPGNACGRRGDTTYSLPGTPQSPMNATYNVPRTPQSPMNATFDVPRSPHRGNATFNVDRPPGAGAGVAIRPPRRANQTFAGPAGGRRVAVRPGNEQPPPGMARPCPFRAPSPMGGRQQNFDPGQTFSSAGTPGRSMRSPGATFTPQPQSPYGHSTMSSAGTPRSGRGSNLYLSYPTTGTSVYRNTTTTEDESQFSTNPLNNTDDRYGRTPPCGRLANQSMPSSMASGPGGSMLTDERTPGNMASGMSSRTRNRILQNESMPAGMASLGSSGFDSFGPLAHGTPIACGGAAGGGGGGGSGGSGFGGYQPLAEETPPGGLLEEIGRQLDDLERAEREQINNDLDMFHEARRRLMEDTAAMSANDNAGAGAGGGGGGPCSN